MGARPAVRGKNFPPSVSCVFGGAAHQPTQGPCICERELLDQRLRSEYSASIAFSWRSQLLHACAASPARPALDAVSRTLPSRILRCLSTVSPWRTSIYQALIAVYRVK